MLSAMKIQKRLLWKMIFPEKTEHTASSISGSDFIRTVKNEQGFVLVLSLMVLVVLTLLGISASRTSVTELEIAGNDNLAKMLLYYAESGAYEAAQRLENIQGENEDCPLYPNCLMFDQNTPSPSWMSDSSFDLDSALENNSAESKISPTNSGTNIRVDMAVRNRGRVVGESTKQTSEGYDIPKALMFEIIGRATRTEAGGKTIVKMVEIGYRKNFN